ncbi:MAG: hypothetical protein J6O13_09085 [Selenomonas sp.]|nr:hypothetical protein [Selenomonas sp.]
MGTITLIGIGVFLGWLMFRPKNDNRRMSSADLPQKQQLTKQQQTKQQMVAGQRPQVSSSLQHRENNSGNHTLRNVAGGMVAGAVLGHMLSGDHKTEAHETVNNYNVYNDYYDHEHLAQDEDVDWDDDYDMLAYDEDDDDSYNSYDDDDYTGYEDDSYDSSSDWGSDSYDDGGDW